MLTNEEIDKIVEDCSKVHYKQRETETYKESVLRQGIIACLKHIQENK